MERSGGTLVFIFIFISFVLCDVDENDLMTTKDDIFEPPTLANWPNGTVPFHINSEHFDNEQTLTIMTSLSLVAFKTCLKFNPVMVPPNENEHVLAFENPTGVRKCDIVHKHGHPKNTPHVVILGYDCLKAPWMDRILLRALGLPFEHNRQDRDNYIDVQYENIEQNVIPLFTRDVPLPAALRALPYDINSVMHFGDRDFSKNGHRTIIFKIPDARQRWDGLSELDLRKIEIIYGPECRERDRQEKIELCHMYPGIAQVDRRKRSIDLTTKSLRVNPDITAPSSVSEQVQESLKSLGIEDEVQKLVEEVHKVTHKALANTRTKYCNGTKEVLRSSVPSDILGIIQAVSDYAQIMVESAVDNVTVFCADSDSIDNYERSCPRCPKNYFSTKVNKPFYSTRHRPAIAQSTKHVGGPRRPPLENAYAQFLRSNDTDAENVTASEVKERVRRHLAFTKSYSVPRVKRDADAQSRNGKKRKDIHSKKIARQGTVVEWDETGPYDDDSKDKESGIEVEEVRPKKDNRVEKNEKEHIPDKTEGTASDVTNSDESQIKINKKDSKEYNRVEEIWADQSSEEGGKMKKQRPHKDPKRGRQKKGGQADRPARSEERVTKNKRRPEPTHHDNYHIRKEKKEDGGEVKRIRPNKRKPQNKMKKETAERIDTRPPVVPPARAPAKPKRGRTRILDRVELPDANKEFYKQRIWPDGVVPYLIDTSFLEEPSEYSGKLVDVRNRLQRVNEILLVSTCVQILELADFQTANYTDYLVLDNSPDFVTGRTGGRQKFGVPELLEGGQHHQHTAMMVMSMLGFYFEVSRHDRDEHIKVHQRHIRPDKLHHFEKISPDATLPFEYDYASATHPAWQFWRQIGHKGISTVATYKDKDPDGTIMRELGQHEDLLSETDIMKINSVYNTDCTITDPNVNEPKDDWESNKSDE